MINTVRSLFFPDVIGSYYLFPKRVVGCEITKSSIRLTLVKAEGKKRTIENYIEYPIEADQSKPYAERIVDALKMAFSLIGKYDEINAVLPGNLAIIRELTLPFINIEKINLVLPFELEPLLPFSLNEASIDCIITSSTSNTSRILAVAVKNENLNEYRNFFKAAELKLQKISVDFVELYAFYKAIHPQENNNIILLYLGNYTTRIACITEDEIVGCRVLPQGLIKLAKSQNVELEQFIQTEALLENPQTAHAFFNDISFSIEAIKTKLSQPITKAYIVGPASGIKNIAELFSRQIKIATGTIPIHTLIEKGIATLKTRNGISNNALLSTVSALCLEASNEFNLNTQNEANAQEKILGWQLITLLLLATGIISAIIINGMLTSRRFNRETQASQTQAANMLKKEFPAIAMRAKGTAALDPLIRLAQAELNREKNIWYALSPQNRASFLLYLQELSTRIDADGLGLNLTRLTLTEDSLIIEGSVKDYDALKHLEDDLKQSKLFSAVPRLEELKFTAKITLDKTFGEGA